MANIGIYLTYSYFYCHKICILQIIQTASCTELPEGSAPALVSTTRSPLSASIALSVEIVGAVPNLSTEMTVDGVCISSEPNTIRLLIRTSI